MRCIATAFFSVFVVGILHWWNFMRCDLCLWKRVQGFFFV